MIIYPKIDNNFTGIDKLVSYIDTGIEVQLLNENIDIRKLLKKCKSAFPGLKEVTLHTPMSKCEIDYLLLNSNGFSYLEELIITSGMLQATLSIKVNILTHSVNHYNKLISIGASEMLSIILEKLNKYNVRLLIENPNAVLEVPNTKCTAFDLVENINNENVKMCLDVCHVNCIINMLGQNISYLKQMYPKSLKNYVHQIHFANASNSDGFRDTNTHSRLHTEKDLIRDMNILKELEIENSIYVTEVIEDYSKREEQIKEIELLKGMYSSERIRVVS